MQHPISCLYAVLCAIAFCTPAIAGEQPPAAQEQPPVAQEQTPAKSPLTSEQAAQYIIGPGDTLQVFVWRNPELSTTVPVRPDGKISIPLVEDMVAVGKTPSTLARDIEKVLAEYVRSPQVNIIVTQPLSAYSQVRVVGQVLHPQAVPYREGMTVLDLVLQVGGLGQFASGNKAKIVRTENGKQVEIKVRIADLVNKGDMKQNVPIKPGDVLVVPQSMF
jgi:polysaccharide biosynthesis/export protein